MTATVEVSTEESAGQIGDEAQGGAPGAHSAPVADPCGYTELETGWLAMRGLGAVPGVGDGDGGWTPIEGELTEQTTTTGTWYERTCTNGGTDAVVWAPPTEPGTDTPEAAQAVPPVVLAQEAVSTVTVTTPEIVLDPFYLLEDGRRATLKNIHTWLWVDPEQWETLTPKVEAGPVWVQATITPHTIHVDPHDGSGDVYSCAGPGTPIPPATPVNEASPTCSIQFTEPTDGDTWPLEVWVSYSATWEGFDGEETVSGVLDDLHSAPVTIPLAVLTAKTELIDPYLD